uniref:CD109 molecule n=1 Tax=Anolis carolinensis TaxID=28377 RepID=G1KD46_ANOCA
MKIASQQDSNTSALCSNIILFSETESDFCGYFRYTYGKPVKGKLTVTCFSMFYGKKRNITKMLEFSGSVNFTLDSLEMKNITYADWDPHAFHQMPIEITAVVTETLTGISQNASATAFPKHHDYSLEFFEFPRVLKPSLTFIAMLKITRFDNTPLTHDERQNNVMISVEPSKNVGFLQRIYYMYDDANESQTNETTQNLSYPVPEDGVIQIEFPIQENTTRLNIKAKFLESQTSISIHDTFYSASMTYLQIKKASQDVKVTSPLELNVQSNKPLKEISYMVVSKEQIVAAGKKKSTTFTLTPENSWAPSACVIAYHVDDNGEVINDVLRFPVQPDFKNKIKMHWSKNKARPSEDVTLKISVTEPKTTIGLLVVDKSTKLLGKRSDITEDAVCFYYVFFFEGVDYALYDDVVHPHLENTAMPVDFGNPYVRTNFPETWIWRKWESTETTVNVTVPDTITSWVASAFVISENLGFGVIKMPIELEVFQKFFMSLNLPHTVTRGEHFMLEVNVFNYMKENTEVTVTLDTSDTFEILIISNDINAMGNQRSVWVPSEDGRTVISQSNQKAVLLDLAKRSSLTENLNFTFPFNVVPGSERVQITIIGDMLGPSINGLDSLIKMPYGCGEQNMINFAPNIYVLDYLTKTGDLHSNLKSKAVSYMREGYQRELLYQRDDGSFSAFGNSDHSGSTWLSAFVLRSFTQAQPFIDIDPFILEKTAAWIASHQKLSGEFQEPGRVLHTELQGGTNSSTSLTAYIMAALLEYQMDKYDNNIRRALNFLEFKLSEGISDNHTLALVTYALSIARSTDAKKALDTLNERSEQQGDHRFWISPASELSDSWQPRSVDIEAAGYALLSHAKQQRLLEGIPIMKWLSQQRNHLGGYSSTQDTVVALQALSACAMLTTGIETEMDVTVTSASEEIPVTYKIKKENRFLLKTKELNIMYNVDNSHSSRSRRSAQDQEAFDLDVTVKDDKKDINHLTLNVCTRSGMALIEVGLLSGFSLSPSFMCVDDPIKKVETDEGKVHLYLDSLNASQVCVDIPAVRDFKVANTQDASVTVLDYYEPRRRAVRSYNSKVMQSLSSCTFCEEDECDLCEKDGSSLIFLSCELFVVHISLLYCWLIL